MNDERTGLWIRQMDHFCGYLWNRHSVTVVVSVDRRIQVREVQYKEHFKMGKYVLVITLKYTLCQILVKLQYERFLISKYYVEWHSSQMMILSIKNSITAINKNDLNTFFLLYKDDKQYGIWHKLFLWYYKLHRLSIV